jgi:N-acyl-D-aspartate/D-glutamate deacylase
MTILIKNGLIYDGTGRAPVKDDILIQNERISHLGNFAKKTADILVDAGGMAVTPGIVEINFNDRGETGILSDAFQKDSITKGITTAIGGEGGVSLAPILGNSASFLKDWGGTAGHNAHWRSMKEFLDTLERRGTGINFGTLTGYSSIRKFFSGNADRDLTEREIESALVLISRTLKEGALGISIDLSAPYAKRIPFGEILDLANETAKFKRVMAIGLRHEGEELIGSIGEILEIGKITGANIEINRFQPLRDFSERYKEALKMMEKEASHSHVDFDVLPHPATIVPIHSFLPEWLHFGDMTEMKKGLREKSVRDRVLKYLQKTKMDNIIIAETPLNLKFLRGKSIDDFAKNHGLSKTRALFKLMGLSELKIKLLCPSMAKKNFDELLIRQRTIVSRGDGDFIAETERTGKLAPEKAIAKMTGLPAAKYGLRRRGLLKEGFLADLVIWKEWKPVTVIINGSVALSEEKIGRKPAGKIIRAA